MPYLFKLARRLACIHKLGLVSLVVAVAACREVSFPANPPVEIVVSPDTVSLTGGQSLQFLGFGRTELGDSVPVAVTWSASSGLITTDGWFTADTTPGDYDVTATSSGTPLLKRAAKVRVLRVPQAVSDLTAVATGDHSVRLSFTEVDDGTGQPAQYDVRYAVAPIDWESASPVSSGLCAAPLAGTAIGASRNCTVSGLSPATGYAFQAVALRQGPGGALTSGPRSNVATATTTDSAAVVIDTSVASVTVLPSLAVVSVGASADDGNVPQNTLDNNFATRWSAQGDGQWIRYDLGAVAALNRVSIAWYLGNPVVNGPSRFDLQVSPDASTWTTAFSGQSSGQTVQPEVYDFPTAAGRYLRIVGHGNSRNSWNSITEVAVYGTGTSGSTSIPVGASRPFSAVARDATRQVLSGRTVAWSSSAPAVASVDTAGLVTGLAAGAATITATIEDQSGAAGITVANVQPAPVASVVVSPASAGLLVAATQQLSAELRDAAGNVLTGRSVTWASSAPLLASVSAGGLVTGLALGTVTITATSEGKSGTTTITVGGTGGAPQPGPTDSIIFQDGFESGSLNLWQQIPANGRYSITTNSARVKSGTRALETLFTTSNTYGMITRWFMPGFDEIYVKFQVLFEEGFDERYGLHFLTIAGNRIDNSQSSFGKAGIKPNGTDYFYAGLDPEFINGDVPLKPFHFYTYWPDMTCGASCYGNRFYQTSPKVGLVAGVWQEVVVHIKLNTPGQYDGSQALWVDGVKRIEVQNLRWRTTTDLRLNEIRFDNYMSDGPKTEHLWIDDVLIWRP